MTWYESDKSQMKLSVTSHSSVARQPCPRVTCGRWPWPVDGHSASTVIWWRRLGEDLGRSGKTMLRWVGTCWDKVRMSQLVGNIEFWISLGAWTHSTGEKFWGNEHNEPVWGHGAADWGATPRFPPQRVGANCGCLRPSVRAVGVSMGPQNYI